VGNGYVWQGGQTENQGGQTKKNFRRFAPNFAHPGLKPCRRPWIFCTPYVQSVKKNIVDKFSSYPVDRQTAAETPLSSNAKSSRRKFKHTKRRAVYLR